MNNNEYELYQNKINENHYAVKQVNIGKIDTNKGFGVINENVKNQIENELKYRGIKIDLNKKTINIYGAENLNGVLDNHGSFMKFTVQYTTNGNENKIIYTFDNTGHITNIKTC